MSRLTGFASLRDRRVGIFGVGVEGRAALARLASITSDVILVDDHPSSTDVVGTDDGGLAALLTCDVVLKSSGVPARSPAVIALRQAGVDVTSALNLWMNECDCQRVIAVTGTKGKSTTTALVAFFLECGGEVAHRVGNSGQPPYDPSVDLSSGWCVVEVSSFQSVDLTVAPPRVVVTSLGSDHLDWHGSLEQYWRDKLSITHRPGSESTFVVDTPDMRSRANEFGGHLQWVSPDASDVARALHLEGAHSVSNVALALAVVADALGTSLTAVRQAVLERADQFVPLRGRLTYLATYDGVRYFDDGLATNVLATTAALEIFAQEPLTLIAGGFDRGVDYAPLARVVAQRQPPTNVITIGPAGQRIAQAMRERGVSVTSVRTLSDAVAQARTSRSGSGVVLFSPAAPSFDQYANWLERSEDFARLAASTE